MDENQAKLIAEQLARLRDNLDARLKRIEAELQHRDSLSAEKIASLRAEVLDAQAFIKDHESRLRQLTDSVTSLRTFQSLTSGGTVIASLIATLKAFLSP